MGVVLVYAGLLALLLGSICVLKPIPLLRIGSRRRGAAVLGSGVALAVVGAALPAPLMESSPSRMRLDDFVPVYQFNEVHGARVHAGPDRVYAAIKAVTPGEIRFYRTLTWIRSPRLSSGGQEGLLNAAPSKPIVDAAVASGFLVLAEVPDRELVLGTPPGPVKIAINFIVEDEGNGWSKVRTETRVFATSPRARRAFAVYWRLIYPGSALIRRMWLDAIGRRAEGTA